MYECCMVCPCTLLSTPKMKHTTKALPFYDTPKVVSPHTSCMSLSSSNNPKLLWSYHRMSLTLPCISCPHTNRHMQDIQLSRVIAGALSAYTLSLWTRVRHVEDPKSFLLANNVILAKDCNLIIVSNAPNLNFSMTFRSFIAPLVTCGHLFMFSCEIEGYSRNSYKWIRLM
jgi:hypothetical protein